MWRSRNTTSKQEANAILQLYTKLVRGDCHTDVPAGEALIEKEKPGVQDTLSVPAGVERSPMVAVVGSN